MEFEHLLVVIEIMCCLWILTEQYLKKKKKKKERNFGPLEFVRCPEQNEPISWNFITIYLFFKIRRLISVFNGSSLHLRKGPSLLLWFIHATKAHAICFRGNRNVNAKAIWIFYVSLYVQPVSWYASSSAIQLLSFQSHWWNCEQWSCLQMLWCFLGGTVLPAKFLTNFSFILEVYVYSNWKSQWTMCSQLRWRAYQL